MLELHIKFLATLYTGILMTVIAGLLVYGGFKMHSPKIKGKVISAQMIDISQIQRTQKPVKKEPVKKAPPPPKKQPPVVKKQEPKKVEVKKPEVKKNPVVSRPKPDTKKIEAEKRREQERRKKLEEIRKKRLEAEQRAQKEAEYLEQLNEKILEEESQQQITSSQKGDEELNERNKMMAMYQAAVISAVTRQWNKPPSSNPDLVCHVKVRQIPGGGVVDATVSQPCNASPLVKKSIIDAIKRADPLPYKGFEDVFSRTATFIFDPDN